MRLPPRPPRTPRPVPAPGCEMNNSHCRRSALGRLRSREYRPRLRTGGARLRDLARSSGETAGRRLDTRPADRP
ncbi:hypothetical protein AMK68_00460 [candidate division KD3-62 bacterium DG_56]|uniref:Uncharacterized protein n=1 Tax=candidate division KD3-62 bacterium DG_56 TaxID=1704032 RepID=A0A0S7XRV1_9BACT|nr:MAG: hypothetical protein AMK68_00460 [candidate division KD3-62 bacterium DG_56]